jgi:hypothetical protein
MGFFRNTNVKHSRIDPATGRNKRDKSPVTQTRGVRPQRFNGRIVKGGRAEAARAKKTGLPRKTRSWW